jgi:hypothetical protein
VSNALKKGRPSTRPAAVPEVETRPCPGPNGGLHRLVNTRAGVTSCEGCGEAWWVLDQVARDEVRKP